MVLVCYRLRAHIQLEMKFTTNFALQSRGTWLIEGMPCTEVCKWQTGLSPSPVLFSKSLHLRLHWQYLSRLQFKARGHNFHVELIPVHSPLLRESYLVSYPPLTYMLKFSGFANLTSCFESLAKPKLMTTRPSMQRAQSAIHRRWLENWPSQRSLVNLMPQKCESTKAHTSWCTITRSNMLVMSDSCWNNKA